MSRAYDRNRRKSSIKCSKLRMDSRVMSPLRPHEGDSSKHKELNTVMRKARESQSNYWNKKLLEVEARDPNRWRHSGYKEMYIGESSNKESKKYFHSPRHRSPKSRSPPMQNARNPRSPKIRHSNMPQSRTLQSRSLKQKIRCVNSPRHKSPIRRRSRTPKLSSPKMKKSRSPSLSPTSRTSKEQSILRKTVNSPSSGSTCSDASCSVCSSKDYRPIHDNTSTSKSKSPSPVKTKIISKDVFGNRCASNKQNKVISSSRPRIQTVQTAQSHQYHLKEHEKSSKTLKARKKERLGKLPDDPRTSQSIQMMHKRVKVEDVHPEVAITQPTAETSASDDSDSSSTASHHPPPRMTLSERFGKMAQWSVDRRDMENMRITKVGNNTMKVVVEGEERLARLGYDSPPPGHYPEALLTQGPRGLDSWDDVHVRYDYYKSRGYLRDLTLDDYVKWEEWWYKYQEWLEAERYYEQWASQTASRSSSGSNRKRRRRNNTAH